MRNHDQATSQRRSPWPPTGYRKPLSSTATVTLKSSVSCSPILSRLPTYTKLQRLALPLTGHTGALKAPVDLRLAHAQLVGLAPRASPDSPHCLIQSTHHPGQQLNHPPCVGAMRRHFHIQQHRHLTESPGPTPAMSTLQSNTVPAPVTSTQTGTMGRSRSRLRTLITAMAARRITQRRLAAAQAAAVLHLARPPR